MLHENPSFQIFQAIEIHWVLDFGQCFCSVLFEGSPRCCPLSIRSVGWSGGKKRHGKHINDLKASNWNQEAKYSSALLWFAKTSFRMPSRYAPALDNIVFSQLCSEPPLDFQPNGLHQVLGPLKRNCVLPATIFHWGTLYFKLYVGILGDQPK